MDRIARIGASISIKGEISAAEDLIIAGRVDGSVHAAGHVVSLESGSEVTADVSARGIIVAGTVLGTLSAEERVELRPGADVDGEVATPKLAMSDGAALHGRVQMPQRTKLALAS
jgi:cytoskeletal protein CcmA (bactofilin family)